MNVNPITDHSALFNTTQSPSTNDTQRSLTGELIVGLVVSETENTLLHSYSCLSQTYPIIILLSIIGNVIVVTAILRVQRLRHPTNFILMSLAIADLLVTTTVMIPGFISHIKGRWIFGAVFCNIWLANDITFCTASILHLGKIM